MAPDEHDEPVDQEAETPGWSRVLIFGAATLAVLLIGATIGLVLAQAVGDEEQPVPTAGSVDVGFAQDMSVHHLQAVTMANWARSHSTDPAIEQLAFDIASTQTEQVGRMKGWLMLWQQPEEPLGEYMTWMTEPGGHQHGGSSGEDDSGGAMPGMATEEELQKLRSLSGRELDVYFLQLMLRHHQGGTEMAEYGKEHAQVGAVRTLANSILASQVPEANLMRQLLAKRNAEPLPFP